MYVCDTHKHIQFYTITLIFVHSDLSFNQIITTYILPKKPRIHTT